MTPKMRKRLDKPIETRFGPLRLDEIDMVPVKTPFGRLHFIFPLQPPLPRIGGVGPGRPPGRLVKAYALVSVLAHWAVFYGQSLHEASDRVATAMGLNKERAWMACRGQDGAVRDYLKNDPVRVRPRRKEK
jgi:hypothetical protein